ncbi:substrate-binding domain-containing protein [Mesorhizobium argentiipisi]|uniref:Substrate-binding domain-containing protein n=1 Tax=Mesorhizobium argentiipisi TaxID=3015175 RepID=A0ABU8KA23_9HYPH
MNKRSVLHSVAAMAIISAVGILPGSPLFAGSKEIVYITPNINLSFWRYMSKGVESIATKQGYKFQALNSNDEARTQLSNAQDAIARGVAGIILSPTDSSTAPSVLELAEKAGIPVVISDIGTNSGEYVSIISSDNYEGANGVGKALAAALKAKGWESNSVGIVAVSQARKNGQARTKGFRDAMKEAGIAKEAGFQQLRSYTVDETFKFTQDMLTASPGMKGIFIQSDQPTIGALKAIRAARRQGDVLVAAFDGIPEFIDLLKSGDILVTGMQQPYLMGQRATETLFQALGGATPPKEIAVPVLVVTTENLESQLPTVKETVFANEGL